MATATDVAAGRPVSSLQAACHNVTRIASVSMKASAAPQHGALERRQGTAELLAFVEVRRRSAHGFLSHPQLQCAQSHHRSLEGPLECRLTVSGSCQHVVGLDHRTVEMEMGVDLAVGRLAPAPWSCPGPVGSTNTKMTAVVDDSGDDHCRGEVRLGDRLGRPLQAPFRSVSLRH